MKIVIRADASISTGTGHIMRCLTLAKALYERGEKVIFVCRDVPGNCFGIIQNNGFDVIRLAGNDPFIADQDAEQTAIGMGDKPDWLIVDHYAIGADWERLLRPHVGRIMVIDDLADRPHDCNVLLDQNLFDDMQLRYDGLTPPDCRLFLGPRFALLRDEFIAARRTLRERSGNVKRILLFFGGSDPTNETEKAMQSFNQLFYRDISIDVVVGFSNPIAYKIRDICADKPKVTFHHQVSNMAELMAHADLAIGAGGTTTWERCFLGLPTLIVVIADNQVKPAQATDNAGLARLVGSSSKVTASSLATAIGTALRQPDELAAMTKLCLAFMGHRNASVHDTILSCLYEETDAS
jgi:UDP-2,4-diacetamido-2,4,6-trideoxy-beta-L-altropyranose hydrolase